jgi:hypothetical protein
VFKNSFALSCAPVRGLNTSFSQCFGLVFGLSWRADQADNHFFNRLWYCAKVGCRILHSPYPTGPETLLREPERHGPGFFMLWCCMKMRMLTYGRPRGHEVWEGGASEDPRTTDKHRIRWRSNDGVGASTHP